MSIWLFTCQIINVIHFFVVFFLDGSVPSSAVSSAGPSSPVTENSGMNFSFSE